MHFIRTVCLMLGTDAHTRADRSPALKSNVLVASKHSAVSGPGEEENTDTGESKYPPSEQRNDRT